LVHIDYELLYYAVSWIVMCDLVDLSVIVCDFDVFAVKCHCIWWYNILLFV